VSSELYVTGALSADPTVSVVIPVYRGGPLVRHAVSSMVAQTFGNLEVVVVSDGCSDDLSDLEHMDPRVRVLARSHAGVSVARNAGVAASRGEYVAFLDEDDWSYPSRLDCQLEALRASPSAGMCDGSFQVVDATGAPLGQPIGRPTSYQGMLSLDLPMLSTVTIRRSLFQEVGGFDPTLTTAEDIDFLLRVGLVSSLAFVPDTITEYRRHAANTETDVWDAYPLLQKHRKRAVADGQLALVAAADLGMRRIRRNASRSAFQAARTARSRGDLVGLSQQLMISLYREPAFLPSLAWHRVTRSSGPSPEERMPGDAAERGSPPLSRN
jgi:glycosyltransferase involved in cell wall biosynthesis